MIERSARTGEEYSDESATQRVRLPTHEVMVFYRSSLRFNYSFNIGPAKIQSTWVFPHTYHGFSSCGARPHDIKLI